MISVQPVAHIADDAAEIRYLRHGRERVSVIVELSPADRGETAAIAAAWRNAGYTVYSTELYGDMGRRRRSHRDLRLSELTLRN